MYVKAVLALNHNSAHSDSPYAPVSPHVVTSSTVQGVGDLTLQRNASRAVYCDFDTK